MHPRDTGHAFTFAAVVLISSVETAQGQGESRPLARSEARAVVDGALRQLRRYYVFPDSVPAIEHSMRQRERAGAYDTTASPGALAQLLTEDLRRFGHNPHLRVTYSGAPNPAPYSDSTITPTERARRDSVWLESFRAEGNAFNDYVFNADRLAGNIGYLRLGSFFPWSLAGQTITSAMLVIAKTDAVIIDVRHSGGGDPATVGMLQNYFVDSTIFLGFKVNRVTGRTDSAWSSPTPGHEQFSGKSLYILTSAEIYSAPEALAYPLQALRRATVIGERTRGGAHVTTSFPIDEHFSIGVPHARSINAITGTDWEGTGIKPDVEVPAVRALRTAHLMALQQLLARQPNAEPRLREERQRAIEALSKNP
jgi:hypothetical protein